MQKPVTIPLMGGLDMVSSALAKKSGFCISVDNYESVRKGYKRRRGYERFDGQAKPSEAGPLKDINFDAGTTEPSVNDKIVGATSGAVGYLHADAIVTSGSWVGNDAAGYFLARNVTGTFVDDEDLEVSASKIAEADGTQTEPVYESDDAEENFRQAAIEQARTLIAKVPGSGSVLGVFTLNGSTYAVRDNVGGTAAVLHKATTTGWSSQSLGHTIDFTSATAAFVEAETLTGGTSGATATIERVVLTSGAWDGTGAGYLVLSSISGTFQSETVTSASGSATAGGAQDAITLPAGGRYYTVDHNFFGQSGKRRIYGVSGTTYAFEWDGTVFAPIRTGLSEALDKPTHVAVLSNHLFLAYTGGSLLFSATGLGTSTASISFLALDGAGELTLGQDPTGMLRESKTALIVTGRNCVAYIMGYDKNDMALRFVSEDSGAISDTLQVVGPVMFMDDIGMRRMRASRSIGDWSIDIATPQIEPLFETKRNGGVTPIASFRNRRKEQYVVLFSDGTVLNVYLGRRDPEPMTQTLGFTPTCATSGEDSSGDEIILAGDDEGWVYELDAGQSDDGTAMEFYLKLPFSHLSTPDTVKRWHSALLEAESDAAQVDVAAYFDFDYGAADGDDGASDDLSIYGQGGYWDISTWNEFYWDAPVHNRARVDIQGRGANCSMTIAGTSTYLDSHVWQSITYFVTGRKVQT